MTRQLIGISERITSDPARVERLTRDLVTATERTGPIGPFLAMIRPDLADSRVRYRCTSCGRRRIRRAFGDNKARPDGRALQCRQCKREQSRKARARSKRKIARIVGRLRRAGL